MVQRQLHAADFAGAAPLVARQIIGATLLVDGVGGVIVETEAYDEADAASHCYGGARTARNAVMFGAPGRAYVYRSYGLHWCLNVVCREAGHGAGVLLRALHPTHGLELMRARRRVQEERLLCAGPGRLAQALGITGVHGGMALDAPPFALFAAPPDVRVVRGVRVGISRARGRLWRFALAGSPYVSRPVRVVPG